MAISVTPRAIEHFLNVLPIEARKVRIEIKSQGCSGLAYDIQQVKQINDTDHVFNIGGIDFVIAPTALIHVDGSELDWMAQNLGGQLKFNNPNVKNECGCGESFNT